VNTFEFILTFICAILFTLGLYHLLRTIFVYKLIDKHFYFALTNLGGCVFVFFELLLSFPRAPEQILLLHRSRMAGLFVCIAGWLYCLYGIYFEGSKVPRYYLIATLVLGATIPTDLFLSLPTTHVHINRLGIDFDYRLATTHVCYTAYAVLLLTAFSYSLVRILRAGLPVKDRVFGFIAFLPALGGLNDFAVSHRLIESFMVSEYSIFLFLSTTSFIFVFEEQLNHRTVQGMAAELEKRVAERTAQLESANAELQEALSRVKQLQGLLPICMYCKAIRDDKNYWQEVETYLAERSDTRFSHGVCPQCFEKYLRPEIESLSKGTTQRPPEEGQNIP